MPSDEATQEAVKRRLEGMGIAMRPMPGGRCLVGRLRLQRTVFETTSHPMRVDEVTFATVGSERAKCLKPRALFQLPILRIRDCRDATEIEARIHLAWQRHVAQLQRAESWLQRIGTSFRSEEDRSLVGFGLTGVDPEARVRMFDVHRAVLPGRGPLRGVSLQRAEDRVVALDSRITSGVDLEIHVSNRLDELVRLDSRLSRQRQREARREETAIPEPQPRVERAPTVLLVGPRITREQTCIESLRLRGYSVQLAPAEREAIGIFDRCSPELVLADVQLGRSEGIDLIQSLRQVPGIEEVPVILLDAKRREDRAEAARRMGAAGYLVYPIDVPKIAERLSRIVSEPRRRRFTRYDRRVPVHVHGESRPLLTGAIGRGGMFLATDDDLPARTVRSCRLALSEIDASVEVQVEVIYRALRNDSQPGLGVRFNAFAGRDEPVFIEYLRNLHPERPAPAI